MKPAVFIGSSSESIPVATAVKEALEPWAAVRLWNRSVFKLSASALGSLVAVLQEVNYAVLVWGAEDLVTSREMTNKAPRDNVVFELGLCMGQLGANRAYYLVAEQEMPRIPSDLAGIGFAKYSRASDGDLMSAVAIAATQLRNTIENEEQTRRSETLDNLDCPLTYLLRHMEHVGEMRGPQSYGRILAGFNCDPHGNPGEYSEANGAAWNEAAAHACTALAALGLIRYSKTGQVQINEYGRSIVLYPGARERHGIAFDRPLLPVR